MWYEISLNSETIHNKKFVYGEMDNFHHKLTFDLSNGKRTGDFNDFLSAYEFAKDKMKEVMKGLEKSKAKMKNEDIPLMEEIMGEVVETFEEVLSNFYFSNYSKIEEKEVFREIFSFCYKYKETGWGVFDPDGILKIFKNIKEQEILFLKCFKLKSKD